LNYANVLSNAVASSGWTYSKVIEKCSKKGVRISRSYLCKLCTGNQKPASDEINRVLADVLGPVSGVTFEGLTVAKYMEVLPGYVIEAIIREGTKHAG